MDDSNPSQVPQNQPLQETLYVSLAKVARKTNKGDSRRKVKLRVPCWQHFTKYVAEDWEKREKCNSCDVSYTMKTRSSTSNLNNHFKTCLKYRLGNISDPKQAELTFAKSSQETVELSTWVFNQDATRKALIKMISMDELSFKFVEGEGFKFFVSIACPRFYLSSRWTIRKGCLDLFSSMKNTLQRETSIICLATDTWTSLQRVPYMVLTTHWIDNEWRLQRRIINFCLITSHRGESIGQALEKCLRDWGIEKVFVITIDNASANNVVVKYLRKKMVHRKAFVANGKYIQMICAAHIINLIVQDSVKEASKFVDQVRRDVRYIRASPSRLLKFNRGAEDEMIDSKANLCLDVPTRWNSTYMMLDVAEKYERAFEAYVRDDHNVFLDLNVGHGFPKYDGWENVRRVLKVLKQPFHTLTFKVLGSLHVTSSSLWQVLKNVHVLLDKWETIGNLDIISMASKMREKYDKYWGDPNEINFLVYLAVILDPRRKMDFLSFGVKLLFHIDANQIMRMVDREWRCMFDEYSSLADGVLVEEAQASVPTKTHNPMTIGQSTVDTGLVLQQYLLEKSRVGLEDKSELNRYLKEDNEVNNTSSFDILSWWKMNSQRFPILTQMARDILYIPISTDASESAFNIGDVF